MKKQLLAFLVISSFLSATATADENWQTHSTQLYSNASSYQFYATFQVFRNLLESEWNEETYEKMMYYQAMDLQSLSKFKEKFEGDKIWGPWFEKKLMFQKRILDQLHPLIEKKQKGQKMEAEEIEQLEKLSAEITDTLLS
jgi:hypothetical protein